MAQPISMTTVEWELIKSRLDQLADGQKEIVGVIKELHDCVDDTKDQIKDIRRMVNDMVPGGDTYQHRADHLEMANCRDLKRTSVKEAVKYITGAVVALVITALIFYLKIGARAFDTAALRTLNHANLLAAVPRVVESVETSLVKKSVN